MKINDLHLASCRFNKKLYAHHQLVCHREKTVVKFSHNVKSLEPTYA